MSFLRLSAFLSVLTVLLAVLPMHGILAAANDPAVSELHPGWMAIGLLGGLALFLYGMDHLATALKTLAGGRLRAILAKMTRNRFMAALSGAAMTGLVQSSSVTTVLVVGFVSAGLMGFGQSIAVIMGANVGSTLTAQIIAFRIDAIAPLMIAVGFGVMSFVPHRGWSLAGRALLGTGLLFFGMGMMSDAMEPLRTYAPFIDLMAQMTNPLIGIMIAALFTALVQSSAATTGIVIVLAGQGLVPLEGGIALIFGANIGTCVTALLVTIGKNRDAMRTALGHVFFNVVGVLVWLPFIPQLADIVRVISLGENGGQVDIAREIANAHSIFNIANVVIMIGFVPWIARLIEKCVPVHDVFEPPLDPAPKFLVDDIADTPSAALMLLRNEVMHMGDIVCDVVRRGRETMQNPTLEKLEKIAELDDGVDSLQDAIARFAGKLRHSELLPSDQNRLLNKLAISNHLEAIGDIISEEMTELVGRLLAERNLPLLDSREKMSELFTFSEECLKQALTAFASDDVEAANRVLARKGEFIEKMDVTLRRISDEIGPRDADIRRYRTEVALVERINRLYERARRIARASLAITRDDRGDNSNSPERTPHGQPVAP
ncbi:Na/Pi cotransporter family protein [Thalassospira lucentensis]|uniref:Na/Pi cotransporter family protein n=1 Tax=Thalassospira lucentensis TaxID=168935 RepID=UPI0029427D3D|nr:Na/Pi cotransporter family protein [Thalassospira lucentensis]WOI11085.1 Na/Pi cotransporter family protein [Thalassospira lucentensis]